MNKKIVVGLLAIVVVLSSFVGLNDGEKSSKVVYLTKASFQELVFNYEVEKEWKYKGELPCIIDFYADWCGPCRMLAPMLDELSIEYDGKIMIYKVDTQKEKELSSAFGIRSLPSLLFVSKEGSPQMATGALPKEQLKEAIETVLLGNKPVVVE